MGCDIHMIIQERQDDDSYVTILQDALSLPSSEAREFNDSSNDWRTDGVPDDMARNVTKDGYYSEYNKPKFWLGEHSIGWWYMQDFIDIEEEVQNPLDIFCIEKDINCINILFPDIEEVYYNFNDWLRYYKITLARMFFASYGDNTKYRVVCGYDS